MATILLSAAGNAIGGAIGGSVAGMATASLGKAVGATIGKVLDQRLLGGGAEAVETGKVDRFRLTRAGEGAPIPQAFGRVRVGGQVIWASDFRESSTTTGGGKGGPAQPKTTRYSYSVSLAIALCEGEIATVGRIWADGEEIAAADLNMRVYRGTADQLPDPVMEAVEGAGQVPAYRGTAYVVIEDLALDAFGNRVPQFSFEVVRAEQPGAPEYGDRLGEIVKAVALMPGTGE
ncbi:host specificity protein, partial [Cribrihabitans sp. XS_ASV171]